VLPRFEARYPEIDLELSAATRYVDLHRGEADVAVRIAEAPDSNLVGRRVATVSVGVYGSRSYARRNDGVGLAKLDWLAWELGSTSVFATWIDTHIKASQIRLRLGGLPELEKGIDADLGVTLMPVSLGEERRTWQRLHRVKEIQAPVWVLSHPDLKTTARVRAVRDFIGDVLAGKPA
jgi:DNA-binding transcriptional LysR family regulator